MMNEQNIRALLCFCVRSHTDWGQLAATGDIRHTMIRTIPAKKQTVVRALQYLSANPASAKLALDLWKMSTSET